MNKINFKSVLVIVVTMSLSVFTFGQNHEMMNMNHHKKGEMHKTSNMVMLKDDNLNKAYMHYVMIRKDIFNANTNRVKMMSKMLVDILNNYGKAPDAKNAAAKLAEASDIEMQRKLFAELTLSFEPLLKGQVAKGTVYKNFCPMANGSGAYWFSNSEKIMNPYMGTKMPSCGSVKETFKSM